VIRSTETLSAAVVELRTDESESTDGDGDSSSDGDGDSSSDGDGDSSDDAADDTEGSSMNSTDGGGDTGDEAPGFGVVAAAVALLATGLLARRE
jgi:iron complex transport system substrate-binding protein